MPPLLTVDVIACQRVRQAPIGPRLASKQLKDRQPASVESVRRAGEIDPPDAIFLFANLAPRGLGIGLETLDPVPERSGVMLAKCLGVDQFEPFGSESLDHAACVRELSTGENVLLDEIADAAAEARTAADPVVRDAVVEHKAARLQDALDLAEVARIVADAHVLEHSDAGDLVVERVLGQVEIVE